MAATRCAAMNAPGVETVATASRPWEASVIDDIGPSVSRERDNGGALRGTASAVI